MKPLWHAFLAWARRREKLILLAMGTVVVGTVLFFAFSADVLQGDTQQFDEWAVGALRHKEDVARPRGPDWLVGSVRDITALGSIAVIGLFSLAALGFAAFRGNTRLTFLILGATLGGFLMNSALKALVDRPRPQLPHVRGIQTRSFPSGHAMVSAAIYLSLAAVLATREKRRVIKAYLLGVGSLLTVLVGLSRVYLGYHYPSDVLAGWLAGLVWAVFCALATRAVLGARGGPPSS